MQTIQLKVKDDVYKKIFDFLSLLPKNSVTIEFPESGDDEIREKLKKAEEDILYGRSYTSQEAKEKLKNRL